MRGKCSSQRFSNGARVGHATVLLGFALALIGPTAHAQLFTNLQALVHQIPVGDPALSGPTDGPKGITAADFDGDGTNDLAVANTDGSVTVYFGKGGGRFDPPLNLRTGTRSLRGIIAADFNSDGRTDIAVAAPFQGNIYLFLNQSAPGVRQFAAATSIAAWTGARNLATGDFDGNGTQDLVAAGPNNGLRQYRSLGNGTFVTVTNVAELNFTFLEPDKFPKPFYAMKSFRPAGATVDWLAVTHAETNRVWLLAPGAAGALQIRASITNRASAHGMDIRPLLNPGVSSLNDLVTVQRDAGTLEIHAGYSSPTGFAFLQAIKQRIDVPGGPRAVEIVDLNKDGWNDLVVVLRNFDSILTYLNSNGVFYPATERPVGTSPREMVATRFDADSFPDLAVMNRRSADLSILLAYPQQVGYRGVNHLYLTDGNVAGLSVLDFNGDGRGDVIQLHRASGDFSVRLANPDGTLRAPIFYTVGNVPAAQIFADVNNDRVLDQITANLGTIRIEKGYVSVRLGSSNAMAGLTFGPEQPFRLPEDVEGRLFALVPGDFDRDGNIDLAVGFLDSRVGFFRGAGDGSFTFTHAHPFVAQARGLVAGDFDGDGDLDLAGVGVSGEMWVVENPGHPANTVTNLLTATSLSVRRFPPPVGNSFGGRKIIASDQNGDGVLDLIIGSGQGAWLYPGQSGTLDFVTPPTQLAGTTHFLSDFFLADLDHDGNNDLVISCRGQDCLSVFTRTNNGSFGFALPLDAPASRFIATGDLDGDGLPDLVGSGRVLWTALSSHPPQDTPPLVPTGTRPRITNAVINEILAINTALPVEDDGDRLVDWVEIYNGRTSPIGNLAGWKLRSIGPDENGVTRTNEFSFPSFFFPPNGHLPVYFSDERRTLYHTGFRLSGDGGTLVLLNSTGIVDQVSYPPQQPNVSYARYRDGLRSFVFNPFPSPGRANPNNGNVEPTLKFAGVDPATFQPGARWRFYVDVADDVSVSSLTMYHQRLDTPVLDVQQIQLHDDGQHGDVGVSDGCFAGDLASLLPARAELQFYFEITDLNDQVIQVPDEPVFTTPEGSGNAYQLAVGFPPPPLEISEIVAYNRTGLTDTNGTNVSQPDWVEVRNVSAQPVPMDGISLAHQLGDNARYNFPPGSVLAPGEHFVVLCDNRPDRGTHHAPIRLSRSGDTVMLTGLTANHSRTLIDWLSFGPQEVDTARARLGAGGAFWATTPTPGAGNIVASHLVGLVRTNSAMDLEFAFGFPTPAHTNYTVEFTPSLSPPAWTTVRQLTGDGIERVVTQPLINMGFFRVRVDP